jgi:hypothetical protein
MALYGKTLVNHVAQWKNHEGHSQTDCISKQGVRLLDTSTLPKLFLFSLLASLQTTFIEKGGRLFTVFLDHMHS